MEKELLKINILSITGIGLLLLVTGLLLYLLKDAIGQYIRFLLPLPPLAVAAYVFVLNVFKTYNGTLPDSPSMMREVLSGTALAAVTFGVFSLLLIVIIHFARRYL
jgi:hypothetical protein